jgi:hypothetical protein
MTVAVGISMKAGLDVRSKKGAYSNAKYAVSTPHRCDGVDTQ